jgi:protein-disulfide isomerase
MRIIGRRNLILSAGAAGLAAACGAGGGGGGLTEDDVVLGAADAPVTLIEYASTTCPHCAAFHALMWDELKTNYIDTGRVRFVFREFPTAPATVAVAGFQIARCGGATPDQYFVRIGELFRQQQSTFAAGTMDGIRRKLLEIGAATGLSEAQINACINDPEGGARIRRIAETSRAHNVSGTPTLIINNEPYSGGLTWEGLSAALDAAGAAG